MMKRTRYGIVKIAIKAGSGSTLTDQTKLDIVNGLKNLMFILLNQKLLIGNNFNFINF